MPFNLNANQRQLYLAILFVQILGIALNGLKLQAQLKASLAVDNIPENLLQHAHSVVRSDYVSIAHSADSKMEGKYSRIVSIIDTRGKQHSVAVINYSPADKIKNAKLTLYDENGLVIEEFKQKEFQDLSANFENFAGDRRFLYYEPVIHSYPVTVQVEYEKTSSNTLIIEPWRPVSDNYISLESAEYSIRSDVKMYRKLKNIQPDWVLQDDDFHLEIRITQLSACIKELFGARLDKKLPEVHISPSRFVYEGHKGSFADWNSYGRWIFDQMISQPNELTVETKMKLDQMKEESDCPLELAKNVYRFVQKNTRYVSVQLGLGKIKPENSLNVDRLKYGDCKGLTNYTKTLLDYLGISSNYTEVHADSDVARDYDSDFCSIFQGNHIILNIPMEDSVYWIDCTSSYNPFGHLGSFTANRLALQIDDKGGHLIRTPIFNNKREELINWEFEAESETVWSAKVKIFNRALSAEDKRGLEHLKFSDLKEYYSSKVFNDLNLEKIDSISVKTTDNEVIEEIKLQVSNIFKKASVYTLIPYRIRNIDYLYPTDTLRVDSIYLRESIDLKEKVAVNLRNVPDLNLPGDISFENEFGNFFFRFNLEDGSLLIRSGIEISKGVYPPESCRQLMEIISRFRTISKKSLLLKNMIH